MPIRNAGIPEAAILQQVETLCRSVTFENQGNPKKLLKYLVEQAIAGNTPRAGEIARFVFSSPPDSPLVRQEARKLRILFAQHYATAKEGEIRLDIPPKQYGVFTSGAATASGQFPAPPARSVARILEPAQDAEVHQRVTVRGRIDVLHPDLRPWLIVETPVGDHYPQCWISRSAREFDNEVRIGLVQWGADEGAVYVIHLVAVGIEGDAAFYTYMHEVRPRWIRPPAACCSTRSA